MKAMFLLLVFLSSAIAHAETDRTQSQFQTLIPGMTNAVRLVLPSDFRAASTKAEKRKQSELIRALQENPGGKAVVADVYLTRWGRSSSLPILYVGTLPSAVKIQGRLRTSDWKEFSNLFTKQARAQLPPIERQLAPFGYLQANRVLNRILSYGDAESAIILGFYPAEGKDSSPVLLARKVRYVRQAIVLFEVAIDASMPRAVETLEQYVRQMDVKE